MSNAVKSGSPRRAFLAGGAAALAGTAAAAAEPDILLAGGPIYTGAGDPVEALVIRRGRVLYVGDLKTARGLARRPQRLDLAGAAAFPGFMDSHCHLVGVGLRDLTLNLTGVGSIAELQSRLRAWARRQPDGPIRGAGWIETHWPEHRFPTAADLDAVVSDRPVLLSRADGHAAVANTRAIDVAGVSASTPNPAGGEILRDAAGRPTGMFVDKAMGLVAGAFPVADKALLRQAVTNADQLYRRRGWTGVHNMSVSADDLAALRAGRRAGDLTLRVDNFMDLAYAEEVLANGPSADADGRIRVRGVKLYADGALGSRGAALLAPYADRPDSSGLIRTPQAEMTEVMRRARASGAQVAVHAIGDRGNRLALDAIESVLGSKRNDRLWRIEHAQLLAMEDLPRFAALGVTASMQPSHAIGDLYFAPARLGPERLKGAYAWRSLIRSGALVCGGTDAPVEKGDPLIEFYAAVYRHGLDGFAGPDWGLSETLSRREALALFTRSAAAAAGRSRDLGLLTPGRQADVTVFSKDLMTVEPPDILKAQAVMTLVAGEVVHSA